MTRLQVRVDVHERRSAVPTELEKLGVVTEIRSLTVGDYDVGGGTLVERKTSVDLALSVKSGRLWRQLGNLRRNSSLPVLIVEGRPPQVVLGRESGRGLVLAIIDQGIVVLASSGPTETAAWIEGIASRRHARVPRDRPPYTYRSRLPAERPGERLLCAVKGVSIHHARALLDRFGSVAGVIQATPEDWMTVRGIGPVRAAAMADCFGSGKNY